MRFNSPRKKINQHKTCLCNNINYLYDMRNFIQNEKLTFEDCEFVGSFSLIGVDYSIRIQADSETELGCTSCDRDIPDYPDVTTYHLSSIIEIIEVELDEPVEFDDDINEFLLKKLDYEQPD